METAALNAAIKRLKLTVPKARLFQVGEVAAGKLDQEADSQVFQYVSLYDHCIGTSFRNINGINFIISNGFLSSHAYNLALTWLWWSNPARSKERERRMQALRHTYKKFFAESVLRRKNRLIGRAMLLETLIYEQGLMAPMFEAVRTDPGLGQAAKDLASLMTSLTSQHELCHYFKRRSRSEYDEGERSFFKGKLSLLLSEITARYNPALAEEVACDAFAAHHAVVSEHSSLPAYDNATRARMTAFAFLVFAGLVSLEKSAQATAESNLEEEQAIDLTSMKRPKVPFSFAVGRSREHDFRAEQIVHLLTDHLREQGQDLVSEDGVFPLPAATKADLQEAFEKFGEESEPIDGGLTGTDRQRRGLAQLVAESLHGQDEAVEFLLWRSKQFSVGNQPYDP